MGIEDIQISEELETNAPSIKYSGNEGPKSPQQQEQQMIMAQLQEEYSKYVFEMEEQGIQPMTLRQFIEQAMAEGQMSSAQPMAPQAMPPRQMAAFGGIMGLDGRRQYGIGSSLKKFVRKIIPNEVSEIAVKAAPFVAPFNPIAAGLMAGVGGFDQTGRIGSSLKSGLMTYGMGQLARGIGGGTGNLQKRFNPAGGFGDATRMGTGFGKYFSNPMQSSGGIGKIYDNLQNKAVEAGKLAKTNSITGDTNKFTNLTKEVLNPSGIEQAASKTPLGQLGSKIMEYVPTSLSDLNPMSEGFGKKAVGAFGIFKAAQTLLGPPEQVVEDIMKRGDDDFDIVDIRTRVTEAFKDPSGKKLADLRLEFPFLGTQASKNTAIMADGGRIGYMGGGMTMGDPRMMMPQSRMPMMAPQSRMPAAEGGIMDLGGMEKDYRAEGGFVPIGREEKADDVPARLSVNEFVMTADAVRGMGDGDIDLGAKRMENLMGSMENKKGAQQMFDVSERLSEVI